jgi:hypothetical protein
VLQRGDSFRVRTVRPFTPPAGPRKGGTELQKLLAAADANQNGAIDADELPQFAQGAGLPPMMTPPLTALDLDRDGRLQEAELAPWFQKVAAMRAMFGPPATTAAEGLPAPWQAADRDQNRRIDEPELAAVLRRLDPTLARWAGALLRALDRDGDSALQPAELPGGAVGTDTTAAQVPGRAPLPARAPLR